MTDSLPYWKFFADEWISGNIQAHDMETQGVFINLCARAWKDGGYVEHNNDKLARLLRVDKQVLASAIQLLLDDDLLVESCADGLSSKFILLQLDQRSTLSDKRSKAGRKGGKAKQLNKASKSQASAKQRASIKEVEPEAEPKLKIEYPPTVPTGTGKAKSFKQWTKEDFQESIIKANHDGIINKAECINFRDYWIEPSASGRMKFSLQKTWDTRLRIHNAIKMVYSKQRIETKQAANGSDYVVQTTQEDG